MNAGSQNGVDWEVEHSYVPGVIFFILIFLDSQQSFEGLFQFPQW